MAPSSTSGIANVHPAPRQRVSVQLGGCHPTVRKGVLDHDHVPGGVIPEGRSRSRGHARGMQGSRSGAWRRGAWKPEDATRGRPGTSSPPIPVYQVQPPRPTCGGFGVDVGGHDVRLHLRSAGPRRRRAPAEWLIGLRMEKSSAARVAVAQSPANGEHGPDGGVGVLATVLADAGEVALDVARVDVGMVERRREQQHDDRRRAGRDSSSTAAIARSGPRRVRRRRTGRLHDWAIEIDPAFVLDRRSPGGVPSSKKARRYQSPSQPSRSSASRAASFMCARQRSWRARGRCGPRRWRANTRQGRVQEPAAPRRSRPRPSWPTRFIPSFQSPGPDERQPMRARPRGSRRWLPRSDRTARPTRVSGPGGSRRRPRPVGAGALRDRGSSRRGPSSRP